MKHVSEAIQAATEAAYRRTVERLQSEGEGERAARYKAIWAEHQMKRDDASGER